MSDFTRDPSFPDYGDTGDMAGARRSRKAWRLVVLSVLLFTVVLWVAEGYLRHDQAETLYIRALRHSPDNSRTFLRAAVRSDQKLNETPTAKYYQALAVREESDRAMDAYRLAFQADRQNPLFGLRYGAALFEYGEIAEAVQVFREVRELPLENAFPSYLEAAAIAFEDGEASGESFERAMILLARSNNTSVPLIFPRPIWHTDYPETNQQYADLKRRIDSTMVHPLRLLASRIMVKVQERIQTGEVTPVASWVKQGYDMGVRLTDEEESGGLLSVAVGLEIQVVMLEAKQTLQTHLDRSASEIDIELMVKRRQALSALQEFEDSRGQQILDKRQDYFYPLRSLGFGASVLFAIYALTFVIHKLLHLRKTAWSIPHSSPGRWTLGVGSIAMILLLILMVGLQRLPGPHAEYGNVFEWMWWILVVILALFGFVYPALTLPPPEEVTRKAGRLEEMEDLLRIARHTYTRVYFSLIFRYYGILCGLYICIACGWIVSYRILLGLYPWQLNLLVSGLSSEELEVVQKSLALLN